MSLTHRLLQSTLVVLSLATGMKAEDNPSVNTTHVSVLVDHGRGYFILNNTSGSSDTRSGEAKRQ
jgi:hypothetical protein